jgi:hypothetical protein
MDFYILNASNLRFDIQEEILDKVIRKEFGSQVGISVASDFDRYEKSVLTITTEINYIGILHGTAHSAAMSLFSSQFHFTVESFLKSGDREKVKAALVQCHNLAQAHAYSIFAIMCEEKKIPQSGMELTPISKFDYKIDAFIESL